MSKKVSVQDKLLVVAAVGSTVFCIIVFAFLIYFHQIESTKLYQECEDIPNKPICSRLVSSK